MTINPTNASGRRHGFTLLECLVYLAALVMVLEAASKIFFQAWDDSKALRRNAEDIIGVLHVGEAWRADIRAATGPIQLTSADGGNQLHIPSTNGEVVYVFSDGKLWRHAGDGKDHRLLVNIKSSQMQPESRHSLSSWRWELEFTSVRRTAQFRPLFTFESVTGGPITK